MIGHPSRCYAYAPGPFGQVHYQVWEPPTTAAGSGATAGSGAAGATLVLCHQSPSSSEQFSAIYPLLAARGIRAVGVDTPGFGMSTVPDHPPTIEEYADSVTRVLDHLGVERAHILGQHTGSMVAMEATLRHPDRYARLILNTPTPFDAAERADMVEADGKIQVTCEYCSKTYSVTPEALETAPAS